MKKPGSRSSYKLKTMVATAKEIKEIAAMEAILSDLDTIFT